MDWAAFFSMGGYGTYVWGSYLLAMVILAANVLVPLLTKKTVLRRLRQYARTRDRTAK